MFNHKNTLIKLLIVAYSVGLLVFACLLLIMKTSCEFGNGCTGTLGFNGLFAVLAILLLLPPLLGIYILQLFKIQRAVETGIVAAIVSWGVSWALLSWISSTVSYGDSGSYDSSTDAWWKAGLVGFVIIPLGVIASYWILNRNKKSP